MKGTIHWVSVRHARKARVLLYDRLLKTEDSSRVTEDNIMEHLNPESLVSVDAFVEPSVESCEDGIAFQLERVGYFCVDHEATSANGLLTLNRTVALRDTWAKTAGR